MKMSNQKPILDVGNHMTQDGTKIRIICVDAKNDYPVIGLVYCFTPLEVIAYFTREGRCMIIGDECRSTSECFNDSVFNDFSLPHGSDTFVYGWREKDE